MMIWNSAAAVNLVDVDQPGNTYLDTVMLDDEPALGLVVDMLDIQLRQLDKGSVRFLQNQ